MTRFEINAGHSAQVVIIKLKAEVRILCRVYSLR